MVSLYFPVFRSLYFGVIANKRSTSARTGPKTGRSGLWRCTANKWMKMIPNDKALNEFELIWRFTDAQKYTQLSPDEINRFHPIAPEKSLKLWEKYVYPSSNERERHLTQLYVQNLITWPDCPTFRSSTEIEEQEVVPTLKREIPAIDSSELLFFWHAEVCVATDWSLFLAHWDDFCYPSDDSNVIVLPEIGKAIVYIEERWHILPRRLGEAIWDRWRSSPRRFTAGSTCLHP